MRPTSELPAVQQQYSRGGPAFRWVYSRWRQLLAFADLQGADGRPSSTKLMAFAICSAVLYTAVYNTTFQLDAGETWTWPMFWILFLCCAVMFGRWGFDRFFKVMQDRKPPMQ